MMKKIILTFLLLIFTIWATNCKEVEKQKANFQVDNEIIGKLTIHAARNSVKVSTNIEIKFKIEQFPVFH